MFFYSLLIALSTLVSLVSGGIAIYEFFKKQAWKRGIYSTVVAGVAIIILMLAILLANITPTSQTTQTAPTKVPTTLANNPPSGINETTSPTAPSVVTQPIVNTPTTPTFTPPPSPTQSPPPQPGTMLYQADWSQGMNGWSGGTEWNATQNMLLSNGSSCCGGPESIVVAPYPLGNVADYEVVARIQFIRTDNICSGYSFGVMLRMDTNKNGYEAAVNLANSACTLTQAVATLRVDNYTQLRATPFVPGTGWHTYTLLVKGDQLSYFIDGSQYPLLTATDNTHIQGGQVGIEDFNVQMNIQSFEVIAE